MAQLLKTDGTIFEISPRAGEKFSLKELSDLLGEFELLPLPNSKKLAIRVRSGSMILNHIATLIVRETGVKGPLDFVVGNAVVLEDGEI